MRQFMTLLSICAILTVLSWLGAPASSHAQLKFASVQRKKGGNPDNSEMVDGALWRFVATNRDGKQIRFHYRANNSILYDNDTNEIIGKSVNISKGKARVTLNSKSMFASSFVINYVGHVHWTSQADFEGKSWDTVRRGKA
jgi:hypothetical protein